MSYKAEIEFVLYLHSFKNIQIDRQGYVSLRIQIYDDSSPNTNFAIPYNIVPYHKANMSSHVQQATMEENAFHSSTIKIQYADEKYYLNDIFQFKLRIQSLPYLQSNKLYLKFSLMFSSLHSYNNSMDPVINSMQSVVLKLQNIESGIFHYYQASFTQSYASSFAFTLFGMVNDFKLFPYSMRKQVITETQQERKREKEREKISQIEDMLIWSSKYVKNCKSPLVYFYNHFAKILRYNSYVLRQRVNEALKNKREVQFKLPKFYKQDQKVPSNQFYSFFSNMDSSKITLKNYSDEIYELHDENFFFCQEVASLMSKGFFDFKKLENQFKAYIGSEYDSRLIKQILFEKPYGSSSHANETKSIAKKIRKQKKQQDIYPISPMQSKEQQYLFYQICYNNQLLGKDVEKMKNEFLQFYDERNMIVFLCHGFQASSYDMRIIQRGLKQALPLAEIYISCANQAETDGDIQEMGKRLAKQVNTKIKLEGIKKQEVIISFVGHSMGGIIARAALKHLSQFENQLGFYCSLSSPHLGYQHGTDSMIKAGLWVMRKMLKQSKSLDQLSMADADEPQDSLMYKLSRQGSIVKFKKIILISSAEDSYVPWHSARICGYDSKKNTKHIENEMVESIVGNNTVHRIDLNFNCQKNDLDGFIGRKAHINLIINESIFKLINAVIPKLFDIRTI